jgi:ubiquinone/menaquinone biosynthesis C-methylase UbiE
MLLAAESNTNMTGMDFYKKVLLTLLKDGSLTLDDHILVVCGGTMDIDTLRQSGFRDVTISNVDERYIEEIKPYRWCREDAERLSFADRSFDWVMVHAGLHHCVSPHKALIEMYRVSRKGAVVIEARDSVLVRAGAAFGLTTHYEIEAVVMNGWTQGGVQNGPVPNFIYRWTEREVHKTIESAFPHKVNDIRFFYSMRAPLERLSMASIGKRAIAMGLWAAARAMQALLPKQCNSFGFVIRDSGKLKPWMDRTGNRMRRDYKLSFDPTRSVNAHPPN